MLGLLKEATARATRGRFSLDLILETGGFRGHINRLRSPASNLVGVHFENLFLLYVCHARVRKINSTKPSVRRSDAVTRVQQARR